jgi:hypothetical protein
LVKFGEVLSTGCSRILLQIKQVLSQNRKAISRHSCSQSETNEEK